jgi:hypothetical protein
MPRFAHFTRAKTGSQWVRDVLSDPDIVGPQGVTAWRTTKRDVDAFASAHDGTFLSPLFNVMPVEWLAMRRPGDRCVVVLRDPRDAIVSWTFSLAYSHVSGRATELIRPALLSLDLRGKLEVAIVLFFTVPRMDLAWTTYAPSGSELVCRFEDLLTDEVAAFRAMIDHFGWNVSDETLRTVVDRYTFKRRSGGRAPGVKDDGSHFRNAVAGDWRNYFDRDLARRFENLAPGLVRALGYETSDEWWTAQPESLPAFTARDAVAAEDAPHTAAHAQAETMTAALADRDRRAAELQRQADERLALIARITKEAGDRLTALEQTTAAADALRTEVAHLTNRLTALAAENEVLRSAAEERLALLQTNAQAYAALEAQLQSGTGFWTKPTG